MMMPIAPICGQMVPLNPERVFAELDIAGHRQHGRLRILLEQQVIGHQMRKATLTVVICMMRSALPLIRET